MIRAKKSKNDPQAVDAYLATLARVEREALVRLWTLIKETVPQVDERVSYGTTVMFSLPDHPLPTGLVKNFLRTRIRENAEVA
jgi:hypothetical protein